MNFYIIILLLFSVKILFESVFSDYSWAGHFETNDTSTSYRSNYIETDAYFPIHLLWNVQNINRQFPIIVKIYESKFVFKNGKTYRKSFSQKMFQSFFVTIKYFFIHIWWDDITYVGNRKFLTGQIRSKMDGLNRKVIWPWCGHFWQKIGITEPEVTY